MEVAEETQKELSQRIKRARSVPPAGRENPVSHAAIRHGSKGNPILLAAECGEGSGMAANCDPLDEVRLEVR